MAPSFDPFSAANDVGSTAAQSAFREVFLGLLPRPEDGEACRRLGTLLAGAFETRRRFGSPVDHLRAAAVDHDQTIESLRLIALEIRERCGDAAGEYGAKVERALARAAAAQAALAVVLETEPPEELAGEAEPAEPAQHGRSPLGAAPGYGSIDAGLIHFQGRTRLAFAAVALYAAATILDDANSRLLPVVNPLVYLDDDKTATFAAHPSEALSGELEVFSLELAEQAERMLLVATDGRWPAIF